jgi:hypothetical protein
MHLLHGLGLARLYNVHHSVACDFYAVGSAYSSLGPAELGAPVDHIEETGFPRWDHYANLSCNRDDLRSELGACYGLDPSIPWITFFPTWASYTSAYIDREIYRKSLASVFNAVLPLAKSGKHFHLIVKDRPNNAHFGPSLSKALEATLKDRFLYVTESTEEFVASSSLVISCGSNMSVEAGIVGTPAINLIDDPQYIFGPCFPDCGLLEMNGEELATWMHRNFDSIGNGVSSQLQPLDRFCGPNRDGKSAERVALLMEKIVRAR